MPAPASVDEQFLENFERSDLTADQFSHRDHLRLGYLYLTRYDFGEALFRMSRGLKALVAKLGLENKYHETITVAYMALINERLHRRGNSGTWDDFADANADLFDGDILYDYYAKDVLLSETARRTFVLSGHPPRTG